jgi:hypothetical protein
MDGGRSLPPSKQQLMKALIEDGAPVQTILEQVGCCRRTYFNYRDSLKEFGTVLPPGISKIGRPLILTSEMVEVCPMFWPQLDRNSVLNFH